MHAFVYLMYHPWKPIQHNRLIRRSHILLYVIQSISVVIEKQNFTQWESCVMFPYPHKSRFWFMCMCVLNGCAYWIYRIILSLVSESKVYMSADCIITTGKACVFINVMYECTYISIYLLCENNRSSFTY